MKKGTRLLTALLAAAMLCPGALAAGKKDSGYRVAPNNRERFRALFDVLEEAYEKPSGEDIQEELRRIDAAVEEIAGESPDDGDVARAVTDHWEAVYLNDDYRLCLYHEGEETASELESAMPPPGGKHAFVVLGYQLKNGKMTEELKGRCRAAAAAARSYPDSLLICSGGATGPNNPQRNTEAQLMRQYLVHRCGISGKRIITDTRAMSTRGNAENTFSIMKKQGIDSITVVTSSYHQRWGQVLYNAMAALYRKRFGFEARIVGNYCYETEPENERFRMDSRIALSQLEELLQVQDN